MFYCEVSVTDIGTSKSRYTRTVVTKKGRFFRTSANRRPEPENFNRLQDSQPRLVHFQLCIQMHDLKART